MQDGDTITVDLNDNRLDCVELADAATEQQRAAAWRSAVDANGGLHPNAVPVEGRLLRRMRSTARSALDGAGMHD